VDTAWQARRTDKKCINNRMAEFQTQPRRGQVVHRLTSRLSLRILPLPEPTPKTKFPGYVRLFVDATDRSEELEVPPSLEELAAAPKHCLP
jgi:hypothetical protein